MTGRGEGCEATAAGCVRVGAESCEFSTEVRVGCVPLAGLVFVFDEDGDGRRDPGEKQAGLSCSSEGPDACIVPLCNGNTIRVSDVRVEFFAEPREGEDGRAEAARIEKIRDACPRPTATPEATPTPTPTATPEPTPTATPVLPL